MHRPQETNRLLFRELTEDDIESLLMFFSDADATKYITGTKDTDGVKEWLSLARMSFELNGYGPWALIQKSSGDFIGYCGLYLLEDVNGSDEVEILYGLIQRHWGNGYATEAARSIYAFGKDQLKLNRLIALIDPNNTGSIHVAEKIGMKQTSDVYRWDRYFHIYSMADMNREQ